MQLKQLLQKLLFIFLENEPEQVEKALQMQILDIQLLFKKHTNSCLIYFSTAAKIILIPYEYFSTVWVLIKYSHHKSKQKYEHVTP